MVRGVPLEYGTSEHNSDLVHFHIFYMPEKTVLKLFEREVGWEERRIPSTVDRIDDTSFIGEFVAHPVCCARADGTRQTFTVHVSSPDDSKFVPLPRLPPLPIEPVSAPKTGKKPQPKKSAFYCAPCHSSGESNSHKACLFDLFSVIIPHPNGQENEQCQPSAITKYQSTDIDADAKRPRDKEGETDPLNIPTAEFVNTLKIAGRISAKARGKELVIAICNKHTGMNDRLQAAHELGLFLPNAIIQPNGCRASRGASPKSSSCERVIVDVKDEVNNTTLGLYSFRVFIDCVWSAQKIALEPGPLLVGRRKVLTSNQSVRKRPCADKIPKPQPQETARKPWKLLTAKFTGSAKLVSAVLVMTQTQTNTIVKPVLFSHQQPELPKATGHLKYPKGKQVASYRVRKPWKLLAAKIAVGFELGINRFGHEANINNHNREASAFQPLAT
ncbi:hypothetical protein B0H14DRAFT_3171855 [Mycena olivaceomarginata]|nr:hypothetical protein B0H14DRAFT_3171855 [Mycena olivaceomarginata]